MSQKARKPPMRVPGQPQPVQYAHVVGWGADAPDYVMTNLDIERFVNTSDKWIRERTGIAERRIAGEREDTVSMGARAARRALAKADIQPRHIDLVVCATSTPQYFFPATASLIQDRLGCTQAGAFDVLAACTGFIYALSLAAEQIKSGAINTAIVIGTETLSRIVDWEDRNTCILFGDGAGAFVLQASPVPGGVGKAILRSDGSGGKTLYAGSGMRTNWSMTAEPDKQLRMEGREVFRFATRVMTSVTQEAAEENGLNLDDIDIIVPHQANIRIIEAAARGLKLPMDKFVVNLNRYGNTSTASIPLAATEAVEKGRINANDRIVLVGFGGGLTWGAVVVEWDGEQEPPSTIGSVAREGWYLVAAVRSRLRRWWRLVIARIRAIRGK